MIADLHEAQNTKQIIFSQQATSHGKNIKVQ